MVGFIRILKFRYRFNQMEFNLLPRGLTSDADRKYAPNAHWTNPQTLAKHADLSYSPKKLYIGETTDGSRISMGGDRHILTIAGTRSGKGTSAIIPNLLTYEGSVLVTDPKGENATITTERRGLGRGIKAGGMKQDIFVIDPFNVANVPDEYRAGFDPISYLDPTDPNFIDDCDSIADALVVAPADKVNDFWNGSARSVLRGFIAWVADAPGDLDRSLNELRRLLHLPPEVSRNGNEAPDAESFEWKLMEMLDAEHVGDGIPSEMAAALLSMDNRERASVMATIRQNIGFLSSPPMVKMFADKRRLPDLKQWKMGGVSIYLCLPAGRLHRHNRFFRLFINQLLSAVESNQLKPEVPALMILDEMHTLGHMSSIETSTALLAGYGVRIWSIWQDLSQIKHLYKERWETFIGNAGITQLFGLNDLTTLEYVSKRLGKTSVIKVSQNEISLEQSKNGFTGETISAEQVPLLTPDEVALFFARQYNNQLIIYPGITPIFLKKPPYYERMKELFTI